MLFQRELKCYPDDLLCVLESAVPDIMKRLAHPFYFDEGVYKRIRCVPLVGADRRDLWSKARLHPLKAKQLTGQRRNDIRNFVGLQYPSEVVLILALRGFMEVGYRKLRAQLALIHASYIAPNRKYKEQYDLWALRLRILRVVFCTISLPVFNYSLAFVMDTDHAQSVEGSALFHCPAQRPYPPPPTFFGGISRTQNGFTHPYKLLF